MYSAGTVKQYLVGKKLAAYLCGSNGHDIRAISQSHLPDLALNPEPIRSQSHPFNNRGFCR